MDELRSGLSWGGGIAYQDRTRQEAESEPTGTYLWRVLVGNTAAPAPLPLDQGKLQCMRADFFKRKMLIIKSQRNIPYEIEFYHFH